VEHLDLELAFSHGESVRVLPGAPGVTRTSAVLIGGRATA
jgi:hypothetical protein